MERGSGGVGGVGTLLGPEGAGESFRLHFSAGRTSFWVGVVVVRLGSARGHTALVGGCWWFAVGVGSARSLRTVQWTRASLLICRSSF